LLLESSEITFTLIGFELRRLIGHVVSRSSGGGARHRQRPTEALPIRSVSYGSERSISQTLKTAYFSLSAERPSCIRTHSLNARLVPHLAPWQPAAGPSHKKPSFGVRSPRQLDLSFGVFRRNGAMGLFLVLFWCAAVAGNVLRHDSRFCVFNSRLRRRKFPFPLLRELAGKDLICLAVSWSKWYLSGTIEKIPGSTGISRNTCRPRGVQPFARNGMPRARPSRRRAIGTASPQLHPV